MFWKKSKKLYKTQKLIQQYDALEDWVKNKSVVKKLTEFDQKTKRIFILLVAVSGKDRVQEYENIINYESQEVKRLQEIFDKIANIHKRYISFCSMKSGKSKKSLDSRFFKKTGYYSWLKIKAEEPLCSNNK